MRANLALSILLYACASPIDPVDPGIDRQLVINEVMADNALTLVDDGLAAGDWIELFNPTDHDIPLRGYGLTDDLDRPGRGVIGDEVVPAGGHLLIRLAELDLDLAREGGALGLSRPDGSWIDRLTYGAQEVDFAAAREPDGAGTWVIEWHPSPGAANPDGDGGAPGEDPELVPAAGDLTERILAYDVMPEIELRLADAAIAALRVQPRTYVPGELVFDGRVYGPVGVRLKGNKSFLPIDEKPSFRINIDELAPGAKFFGLDDLTFNNMSSDRSMLRERLAYRVARDAGVPAPRANHALITVNGDLYGLYANVETVKWRMVGRWFDDAQGSLWEGVAADFVPSGEWELESGPDDRRLIEGTIDAMTNGTAAGAIAEAGSYVSMAAFLRFWATCAVIGQFDSLPTFDDDYFLYADPQTDRLHFIPWGMDESMSSSAHDVLEVRSVLATHCLNTPACKQDLADQAWDVLALTEELDLEAERLRVAAQIADAVARDTRKPYTDADVAAGQNDVKWFIRERRERLGTMLPGASN
jgi:hypothetical protein